VVYVAEGLGGYDSALQLICAAWSSIASRRRTVDRDHRRRRSPPRPRQAGALDPRRALAEAYRRNNAGNYAESAEFFAQLTTRDDSPAGRAEALANEGVQKSNLGRYGEADALFDRAEALAGADPVIARRLRNYRAMHLLNQGLAEPALAELGKPVPDLASESVRDLVIDQVTSSRLSGESPGARRLAGLAGLTPEDKAQILDGQALQLRGTVMHLQNRDAEAVEPLNRALDELVAIRGGRIAATLWMRAQIYAELADLAEERSDQAEAERLHLAGVDLLEANYPGSSALLSARGRLASFYARTGRADQAATIFREIVAAVGEGAESSPTLRRILEPWFDLLVERGSETDAVADLFAASQVLVRPGVAQTQAVLARELSGGSDEAARLFRQSVTLTRDIERARVELARIEAAEAKTANEAERALTLRETIAQMQQGQAATQARLADFPRYRVVASNAIALADLQHPLGPGEAYYKMMAVNDDAYAIFVTSASARAFRIGASPAELEVQVNALRDTISLVRNNQNLTYPFDLELSWRLYQELFGPVEGEMSGVTHLVFEPDGALLRLPPNLLVMDRAGVDAYKARAGRPDDDAFDFRGIQWLGRDRDVSTAVSARAFRDVRQAPRSAARAEYIGFGQNAPATAYYEAGAATRGVVDRGDCSWPLPAWNRPIAADELFTARRMIAAAGAGDAEIVTGADFTDTRIMARPDLNQFRILHFATHGLVTGPREECPAQPALLTSFDGPGSDGLLTFSEIYDLRLDADLIILSACDTAGHGSQAGAEAAGVTGEGDFSLDGLVRAFVGAGSRIVVGSHWPVPVDFDATQRLFSGLFLAPPGTGTAAGLRRAQIELMDNKDTSHPYYWSGFAVVGDGAVPVIRTDGVQAAGGH
jgi:CHAT domain-containing protein